MDTALLIEKYLSNKKELIDVDNDSFNIVDNAIFRWDFKNIPQPSIEELEALSSSVQAKLSQDAINKQALEYLASTDYKVLRHLRQKALGVALTLSEEEYLALEQLRHEAANRIV